MKHLPRVYTDRPLDVGAVVRLDDDAGHHLARVLRTRAGDPVVLFNGLGGEFHGRIDATRGRSVDVRVERHDSTQRESPLRITLAQGLSRGARMDYTVEKATELGVHGIVPVHMVRSVIKLDAERAARRTEHWRKVAVAACQQCGRNRLPGVARPVGLAEFLADAPPADISLMLDAGGQPLKSAHLRNATTVTLLIGPEGGFDEGEREAVVAAGFKAVCLGPRVLRTETAGVVGLGVLQFLGGDLGS